MCTVEIKEQPRKGPVSIHLVGPEDNREGPVSIILWVPRTTQGRSSLYHLVSLRDGTQVIKLGTKFFNPMSHFANPFFHILHYPFPICLYINAMCRMSGIACVGEAEDSLWKPVFLSVAGEPGTESRWQVLATRVFTCLTIC